jgi:hypothetical protein
VVGVAVILECGDEFAGEFVALAAVAESVRLDAALPYLAVIPPYDGIVTVTSLALEPFRLGLRLKASAPTVRQFLREFGIIRRNEDFAVVALNPAR